MKICDTCGEKIDDSAPACRYCEQPQPKVSIGSRRGRGGAVCTINLEAGHPLVEDALNLMERKLYDARLEGTKVVRLIHGYGSSGTGGAIRVAVRKKLSFLCRNGSIKRYVGGEECLMSNVGRALRSQYSQLRLSLATDQRNPGITLVEL